MAASESNTPSGPYIELDENWNCPHRVHKGLGCAVCDPAYSDPADNDEFVCDECGDTWDIEDSYRKQGCLLLCPECYTEDAE